MPLIHLRALTGLCWACGGFKACILLCWVLASLLWSVSVMCLRAIKSTLSSVASTVAQVRSVLDTPSWPGPPALSSEPRLRVWEAKFKPEECWVVALQSQWNSCSSQLVLEPMEVKINGLKRFMKDLCSLHPPMRLNSTVGPQPICVILWSLPLKLLMNACFST